MMLRAFFIVVVMLPTGVWAEEPADQDALVAELKALNTTVGTPEQKLAQQWPQSVKRRLAEANQRSTAEWQALKSRDDWEAFRAAKLAELKAAMHWPSERGPLEVRVTGKLEGDGFVVENLVFSSRPGLWVTANLYRPADVSGAMPGFLISHSHHNPKTEAELQTMGMTWARAGCLVLVMDHLGHGERRQHPFRTAADFPREAFRAGRQDYWFRHDTSLQLYLTGESLMGYMTWDLSRGVNVLLSQEGIDPKRIILLGAVAGGGDPAAVTAALDERITVAAPFNFGGPQPESRYPLPDDAEATFGYAGSGSWESTRNLAGSASAGFLPWVIVGSIAPRKLIYGHEFSWDRERDPVWKRLEKIYEWYGCPENLAFAHGTGTLKGQPPEASHCNNIGSVHRKHIHAALRKWYGIEVDPDREYKKTFSADQLRCMTPEAEAELRPMTLGQQLAQETAQRRTECETLVIRKPANEQRRIVRELWQKMLRTSESAMTSLPFEQHAHDGSMLLVEHSLIDAERSTPVVLLLPKDRKESLPLVVCVAQQGKAEFLKQRREEIAHLLGKHIAVALVDVRGTGELAPDAGRDRGCYSGDLAASELMLGRTLMGEQLTGFRRALAALREHKRINAKRVALWGASFAKVTATDADVLVPHGVDRPPPAEPVGGMLVLLAGLFENDIQAIVVERGLVNFASAFAGPCVYLPLDAIVPGAASGVDISDLVARLDPLGMRFTGMVDATNRRVTALPVAMTELQADERIDDWIAQQSGDISRIASGPPAQACYA
jgi:cephalosporin-C deacetylase-like acetyl esterase